MIRYFYQYFAYIQSGISQIFPLFHRFPNSIPDKKKKKEEIILHAVISSYHPTILCVTYIHVIREYNITCTHGKFTQTQRRARDKQRNAYA